MTANDIHSLYGSTNETSSIPDAQPAAGPAFDQAHNLVLSASFKAPFPTDPSTLTDQTLVDALVIWECYGDLPAAGAPVLLRFDDADLVVSPHGSGIALLAGALDTAAPIVTFPDDTPSHKEENERTCLCWEELPAFADALGQTVTAICTSPDALTITFETITLTVENRAGSLSTNVKPMSR